VHLEARQNDNNDDSNPDSSAPTTSAAIIAAPDASAIPVGVLVMGGVTYTLASLANGNLLFGSGATITANAPAATVDGQAISFGVSGLVIDATSTFPVSADQPPSSASASSAASVGNGGEVLATPPPDSSFEQFKNGSSGGSGNLAQGGSAKAGAQAKGQESGIDSGAGRMGASAVAFVLGMLGMLLV
jgi:hypothetical protein